MRYIFSIPPYAAFDLDIHICACRRGWGENSTSNLLVSVGHLDCHQLSFRLSTFREKNVLRRLSHTSIVNE